MPDDRSLQDRLDRIATLIAANSERLASMEATLTEWRAYNREALRDHQTSLVRTGERVSQIEAEVHGLRARVAILSAGIAAACTAGLSWLKHALGWN